MRLDLWPIQSYSHCGERDDCLLKVWRSYPPSSARLPKAIRHISVRAVLCEWMPRSFTRTGITPILISWACKESATQRDTNQRKTCMSHIWLFLTWLFFFFLEEVRDGALTGDSTDLLGDFNTHVGNNSETWRGVTGRMASRIWTWTGFCWWCDVSGRMDQRKKSRKGHITLKHHERGVTVKKVNARTCHCIIPVWPVEEFIPHIAFTQAHSNWAKKHNSHRMHSGKNKLQ